MSATKQTKSWFQYTKDLLRLVYRLLVSRRPIARRRLARSLFTISELWWITISPSCHVCETWDSIRKCGSFVYNLRRYLRHFIISDTADNFWRSSNLRCWCEWNVYLNLTHSKTFFITQRFWSNKQRHIYNRRLLRVYWHQWRYRESRACQSMNLLNYYSSPNCQWQGMSRQSTIKRDFVSRLMGTCKSARSQFPTRWGEFFRHFRVAQGTRTRMHTNCRRTLCKCTFALVWQSPQCNERLGRLHKVFSAIFSSPNRD